MADRPARGGERRLYRLTYPAKAPAGSRYQTGVVERLLTDQQAREFEAAVKRKDTRVTKIEQVKES
jgi:hypothetical protein